MVQIRRGKKQKEQKFKLASSVIEWTYYLYFKYCIQLKFIFQICQFFFVNIKKI